MAVRRSSRLEVLEAAGALGVALKWFVVLDFLRSFQRTGPPTRRGPRCHSASPHPLLYGEPPCIGPKMTVWDDSTARVQGRSSG